MSDGNAVEQAIIQGDWDQAVETATQWSQSESAGPPAFFALNAMHLLRGEFALAWQMHAKSLQEEEDINQVRAWVDRILETHPDEGYLHLIRGLFLAQSGQSEQSMESYQEAVRLAPESPFPHFFLAQIYQTIQVGVV